MRSRAALLLILTAALLAGQQGANLAEEEVPAGALDGANLTLTLAHAPFPWISLKLYRNGIRLKRCRNGATTECDYTLVAPYNKLTFLAGEAPQAGDILLADYRW